ncbi:MAG: FxSxx-COOH system tetratricopeptide repeat protein [Solirubrobacteraceae bacterium]
MTDVAAKLDFFISYTSQDAAWAEWIAWQLEANGYTTIIQAWDYLPGNNFAIKMQKAALRAERMLGVISPAYFESEATAIEWAGALSRNFGGDQRSFIPIRIRNFHPEGLHSPIIYVNLFGCDRDQAAAALLAGIPAPNNARAVFGTERRKPASEPRFPATAWNIPSATRSFTGRESALIELEARLTGRGRAAVTQAHAVYGLGGIGKTQLVARYAELHRDEYDIGWWIKAEQAATRMADLAALGQAVGLADATMKDLPAQAAAARDWLSSSSRWLLVIDDATNPDAVEALMPGGAKGHILITSRAHADWGAVAAEVLALEVWGRQESVEFLLNRTHRNEPDAAKEVAELLGDLPLAVAQAAAYINTQGITLAGYRNRLVNDTQGMLTRGRPHDYKTTVAGTWTLAFEQIREDEIAERILKSCAYLGAERIPRELLDQVVADAGGSNKPSCTAGASDEAVELLLGYSLLTPAGDEALDMHRLVQQVIRAKHTKAEREVAIGETVQILAGMFPSQLREPTAWPVAMLLLPHVVAATEQARTHSQFDSQAGDLLDRAATYLRERAELDRAKELGQQACDALEGSVGSEDPMFARALGNLGIVNHQLRDLLTARSMLERALSLNETISGADDPSVAITLTNLGNVLHDLGDLPAARIAQERALKIGEDNYGTGHTRVASVLGNLGLVLRDEGDLSAARSMLERALKLKETIYEADHPDVATTLLNLGIVLRDQGELSAARSNLERALEIGGAIYGTDHLLVANVLRNLGLVLRDEGDLPAARRSMERALKIDESIYGSDDPYLAVPLADLGAVLCDQGDLSAARSMLERALAILQRNLGSTHEHTLTIARLLASLDS